MSDRKKIVIVTDAWHPQINGVVRCIDELQPKLTTMGYDVELIQPRDFVSIAVPFYREIRLALFPGRGVAARLRAANADYIHLMTEGSLGWAARRWCRKNNVPFTTSYHTQFALYAAAWFGSFFAPYAMRLLRTFHAPAVSTMVAGTDLAEELSAYGFEHLSLWPLGVDAVHFSHDTSWTHPHMKKPIYAYLGRVSTEKNVEEFLAMNVEGTKLVIGDGPARKKLEHMYRNRAVFVGFKKGKELVRWLSLADVLVFPSRTDTFGLVILEALACGVPVAAHSVTGPRGIITPGVDGVLGDDLAEAANQARLLSSEYCRATALRYSWEASAAAFASHLVPIKRDILEIS